MGAKQHKLLISIPQMVLILMITILFTSFTVLAATGTTDATNAPGLSASYTLEDIYVRLINGTAGSQSTFNEPAVAPGTGSMHDLNDIMAAAPAQDNTHGATANQVLGNQTFWGLTNGQWGFQTGSMPSGNNITGANGSLTFNIPDGYYAGKTATASDSDLVTTNIKYGVNILGVSGDLHGGCTCKGTMIGPRWCDNGDGTVTDILGASAHHNGACLVWLKDADCLNKSAWNYDPNGDLDAHSIAGLLRDGDCGLTDNSMVGDWRLPTLIEMRYLIFGTYGVSSSSMWAFVDIQPDFYWTSTTYSSYYFTRAYKMDMLNKQSTDQNKTSALYIMPVRLPFEQ